MSYFSCVDAERPAWARALRRLAAPVRAAPVALVRCEEEPAPTPPPTAEAPDASSPPEPTDTPPLQFENFGKEWQQTASQDTWDGFRIEAGSQVTKHIQGSHTLFLGTQMRQEGYIYQFGPTFQSEGGRTVMLARLGLDGGVNGRWIQKVGSSFEVKASSQSHLKDPQRNMHDASVDYVGKDWTFGLKAAWQGAPIAGGHFSQRVFNSMGLGLFASSSLHVGGDLMCVMVGNPILIGQVGARWSDVSGHSFMVNATRQPDMKGGMPRPITEMKFQYCRKVTDRLTLGAEYKYSHPDRDSGLAMAYEYGFRNARVQGLVDTDGKVSTCVFDMHGMGFSGVIDYLRGDYKFGVAFQMMPPETAPPQ